QIADTLKNDQLRRGEFIKGWDVRWRAWFSRAHAERALGQKEKALDTYNWAVKLSRAWAAGWAIAMATETSAIAAIEEQQTLYREYVDLLFEMGKVKQAYEVADQAKARLYDTV